MQKNFLQHSLKKLNLSTIFFINLFLMLGIVCQKNNFPFLIIFLSLSVICFLYSHYIKHKLNTFLIYPIVFLVGVFLYQKQLSDFENFIKDYSQQQLSVMAKVIDITITKSNRKNLIINITKISNGDSWQDINKQIKLSLDKYANIKDLQISDDIKINDLFIKFPNQFCKDNFIKEELSGCATTKQFSYELINRPYFSLNRSFKNLRNKIFISLQSKMSKNTFALFTSIFLGNKNTEVRILSQYKKQFNNWGLAHYLARSGLHLVIIFLAWFFIISLFPISFIIKQIIIFLIIFTYAFLSWSSIPFIRSLITFALYKTCILLNFQINTLHCLNLACLIMLLINPSQLFFLDFQLSFGLTFALIWINSFNLKQ